jgi:hypothetical protein
MGLEATSAPSSVESKETKLLTWHQVKSSPRRVDRWLAPEVFKRLPLPYSAGWLAAAAFLKYRRSGGVKTSPLPDFSIGAHAEAEGLVLVTRDPVRYRTYFPKVRLVAPE